MRRLVDLRSLRGLALAGTGVGLVGSGLFVGSVLAHVPPGPPRFKLDPRVPPSAPLAELRARRLELPVEGVERKRLADSFAAPRSGARRHKAMDIMAPRLTPVRAVEAGTVARLTRRGAGGTSLYLLDTTGRFCFYYAHLARYALGLARGQQVARGQLLGYVGSTGNAPPRAPHLHFAIFRRTATKAQACQGAPVNPYSVLAKTAD